MRAVDVIEHKRDGLELTTEEIEFLIQGFAKGEIPDYQMSAWAMAVYLRGMNARETADLTMAMARSGKMVDLSAMPKPIVDKHSTGGVGDKTTLVVAPLVAASGLPFAKMSGRGLAHAGGTIDKLESFTGIRLEYTDEEFIALVREHGLAVIGQSSDIAPADKFLYALRDVTATVSSVPLIASSIMSKKIACGADKIVLDVKFGDGAFMKTYQEAVTLAQTMVDIGEQVGRETVAVISSMQQPLGLAVGNSLEVKEAIRTLQSEGPQDFVELCLELAAQIIRIGGKCESITEGKQMLRKLIENGAALAKFEEMIAAQGGPVAWVGEPENLPGAEFLCKVRATGSGYVSDIKSEQIGLAAMLLGAGRETKQSQLDYGAGLVLRAKVGDFVQAGDVLADVYWNAPVQQAVEKVQQIVADAFSFSVKPSEKRPLVVAIVTAAGIKEHGRPQQEGIHATARQGN